MNSQCPRGSPGPEPEEVLNSAMLAAELGQRPSRAVRLLHAAPGAAGGSWCLGFYGFRVEGLGGRTTAALTSPYMILGSLASRPRSILGNRPLFDDISTKKDAKTESKPDWTIFEVQRLGLAEPNVLSITTHGFQLRLTENVPFRGVFRCLGFAWKVPAMMEYEEGLSPTFSYSKPRGRGL